MATPDSVFSLAGSMATRMNSLDLSQERIDEIKRRADPKFWSEFDALMRGEYSAPNEIQAAAAKEFVADRMVAQLVGSHYSGGDVPSMRWNPARGKLEVGWAFIGFRNPSLRFRVAVG